MLGSQTIRLLAYSALSACCANNVEDSDSLSPVIESLAAALMSDFRPPSLTATSSISNVLAPIYGEWLRSVHIAHMAVLNRNTAKGLHALIRLLEAIFSVFKVCSSSLGSEETVAGKEKRKLANLTVDLLQTWIGVLAQLCHEHKDNTANLNTISSVTESLTNLLESSLGFENHQAWPQALHFIASVFAQLGSNLKCVQLFAQRLLPSLAELQFSASNRMNSSSESSLPLLLAAIDNVFGSAIAALGPEFVINVVPVLNFSNDSLSNLRKSDVDTASWMLSLFSRHVGEFAPGLKKCSRLNFFIHQLLPIQQRILEEMEMEVKKGLTSPHYSILYSRIWSTIPAFFSTVQATGDGTSLSPNIAKLFGQKLANDAHIRPFLLNAFKRLVENAPSELSRYSKNFLPILFNLHANQAEGRSDFMADDDGSVLQLVRLWFSKYEAVDMTLAMQFLEKTWQKMIESIEKLKAMKKTLNMEPEEEEKILSMPPLLLDLCIAMLNRFPGKDMRKFIIVSQKAVVLSLLNENGMPTLQKRAYRLIEDALEISVLRPNVLNVVSVDDLDDDEMGSFVREEIKPLLAETLPQTSAPARRSRLTALLAFAKAALLTAHGVDDSEFYSTILWEAVASLVDVNARARCAAVKLLAFISSAMATPSTAIGQIREENPKKGRIRKSTVNSEILDDEELSSVCNIEHLLRLLFVRLPVASVLVSNPTPSAIDGTCAIMNAIGHVFKYFKSNTKTYFLLINVILFLLF